MSKADLHMHSTASDGGYTPSELMHKCKDIGLSIVSLTDHDTTDGIQEAKEAAALLNITVINGIELSTKSLNKNVHILGYGIDTTNQHLQHVLKEQRYMREERLFSILDKLSTVNIFLPADDVLKYTDGGSVGRPHVAKALVEKQIVQDIGEAFDRFLAEGKPCYVDKSKEMSPKEAIDLIHLAGGVAVVAHPVYYNLDDEIEKWILDSGLDGIEVYHRDHDQKTRRHYEDLTIKWENLSGRKLLRTGGSDFHHENYGRHPEPLGYTTIPVKLANLLLSSI